MTASPAYAFHALTDVGRQREQNEDACAEVEAEGGRLLIVCDGMGGHESGEVASRIAVDTIAQIFQNSPAADPGERLKAGFLVANQRILTHADSHGLDRMGTTAVATFVRDGEAWIAHVGDSRVYHLRGGAVLWRTADHTRVQKMVERGILTAEQAKTHEDANIVTRALGFAKGEEQPEPDVAARPLRDGDTLLLCSDGLHDLVKDEEIAELASYAPPAEVTRTLVELANRRGGHDNVTVAVLRWGTGEVARPAGARRTALEFADQVPVPQRTLDGTQRSPGRPAPVAAAPPARSSGGETADDRPRRALVLVIAGVALVGLAAAVFLVTRSGARPAGEAPPRRDAGAAPPASAPDAAAAAAIGIDAGGADAARDGGLGPPPSWDTADPARPRPRRDGGAPVASPLDGGGAVVGPVDAGAVVGPVDAGVAATPRDAGARRGSGSAAGAGSGASSKPGSGAPPPSAPPARPASGSGTAARPGAGATPDAGATP